jgi:hypothetical protein
MFENPSLTTRIFVGKGIGLIVGLIGFFVLPVLHPDTSLTFRWAILLWYISLGAFIGLFGVYTRIPLFNIPMPWWFRGPLVGAWMNFVVTLLAYENLQSLLIALFGTGSLFQTPFWFVFDGAVIGLLMGYFTTRLGGEGRAAVP